MSRPGRPERRSKQRIQLTRAIAARLGTMSVVILDVTDSGARVEHFTRLDVGRKIRLRFMWQIASIEVEAKVVACRVHRFAHGDDGATVYQSGLFFTGFERDSQTMLQEMVTRMVSLSLAEQVANARGLGPVLENEMPVFREGVVATTRIDTKVGRGYLRCTFIDNRRWEKKWSRTPEQPPDGFTLLATEPDDHVNQLCDTYKHCDRHQRELIRVLAQLSVEEAQKETPQPVS
jgi:hypothetical protein